MFKPGDTVSHAQHGLAVIRSIEVQEVLGSKSLFATLYFERQGLQMIVPKAVFDQRVRLLMTESKAREVLAYIDGPDEHTEPVWKKRQKENQERLTSGDPLELCTVAKSLIRLRTRRPLAASDTAQLKSSLDMLAEELSAVLGGEQEQMATQLERACVASLHAA